MLYGTSYGTKVAERYAQTYPSHVSALVLDSVVPPNGPEPLNLPTFAAIPRVLRQLCAQGACAHITSEPVADLAKVVKRMRGGGLSGRWIDGDGHVHMLRATADDLLQLLITGDLEPTLRAEFPEAARSAANGDTAPLMRMLRHAEEHGEEGEEESPSESFNTPLYFATSCEDELFGWNRASTPAKRLAEARVQIGALPASQIAPFGPANVLDISDIPPCAFWPYTTPAPAPVQAPFPSVPTLILSGAGDLRTPTANAREVAAQIPGSQLVVVPEVGHSVLGSDLSGCASKALQALFKPAAIKACAEGGPQILGLLKLTPLAPARISAVPPAKGYRGLPGRTLTAVGLTLADFLRQAALQTLGALESGNIGGLTSLRIGGLRAGWAGTAKAGFTFHGYSYVPGVTVSGKLTATEIVLHVGGPAAARGTLRFGPHRKLAGTLGGRRVHAGGSLDAAGASAAIVRMDAQASPKLAPGGSAARAAARELAGLLERLP